MVRNRFALDHDFLSRQRQVDAHVKRFPFSVMAVRNLNGHAASENAMVKSLEFHGLATNPILNFGGVLHVAKREMQWNCHGSLSWASVICESNARFVNPSSLFSLKIYGAM